RAVELELVRTIIRQPSVRVSKQADQVEQRSDVRIGLTVVITEQSFVVSDQARIRVRSDELIVVGESLRCRELETTIVATCRSEATDRRITASLIFRRFAITAATRVEEEVVIAVIK